MIPDTPIVELAHTCLTALYRASSQGAIAIGLVWCLCRWVPRVPPSVRCWLWRLVLVKMLLVALWPGTVDLAWLPAHSNPSLPAVFSNEAVELSSVPTAQHAVASPGSVVPTVAGGTRHISPQVVLWAVWVSGVSIVVAVLVFRIRSARRWRKQCTLIKDSDILGLSESLSNELGVYQPPVLFVSEACTSPVVFGAMRTSIILPSHLLSPSDMHRLRLILRHELAHIRRGDLLWNWVATAVWGMFFFHPLVWLALRELRLNQELACDARAIEPKSISRADYGSLLVELASQARLPTNLLVTVGVVESFEFLKRRLKAMADTHDRSRWTTGVSVALVSLAIVGLLPWRLVAQALPTEPAGLPSKTVRSVSIAARPAGASTDFEVKVVGTCLIDEATARNIITVADSFPLEAEDMTARSLPPTEDGAFSSASGSASASSGRDGSSSVSSGSARASSSEGHSEASWSGSADASSTGSSRGSGTSATQAAENRWPNYAIDLEVSDRRRQGAQLLVKLLDGVTAEDNHGNTVYGPRIPPHFAMEVPNTKNSRGNGHASVLLNILDKTARSLLLLKGELLVVEAKVNTITFEGKELAHVTTRQLDGLGVRLDDVHSAAGALTVGVSIAQRPGKPEPAIQPRGLSDRGRGLFIELEDSAGTLHVPRNTSGSSDSEPMEVWSAQFAPLPQSVKVNKVICTVIQELGPPQHVPFDFRDVPLP